MSASPEQITEARKTLVDKLKALAQAADDVQQAIAQVEQNGDITGAAAVAGAYPFDENGLDDVATQIQSWAWMVEESLTGKSGGHP